MKLASYFANDGEPFFASAMLRSTFILIFPGSYLET